MVNYKVAIPSYDRAEILRDKTLKTLISQNIKPDKIDIFVANEEEEGKYKDMIDKKLYNKMIVGVKGLVNQRNFITNYYNEGDYIIQIDDDVEGVYKKKSPIKTDKTLVKLNLDIFFKNAYDVLIKKKLYIWGVLPVFNPYFATNNITTDLRYIVGALFGCINRKSKDLKLDLESDLEDFLRTILFYKKDSGVVRFNNILIKTKYYGIGGLQTEYGNQEQRIKDRKKRVLKLQKLYPEYISKIKERKSGVYDIVLNRNPIIKGGASYKNIDVENLSNKELEDVYYEPIKKTEEYNKLKTNLFEKLEETSIPRIEGPRKDGRATRGSVIGYIGWTVNFGCGGRRNLGVGEFKPNERFPELFKLLVDYGNYILPKGYTYEVITVNKDVLAKRHKDKNNNGFTVATCLGNFTGGRLIVGTSEGDKKYNLKDHILAFNGALLEHQTEKFNGRRYTIIFYKQKKPCKIKGKILKGNGVSDISAELYKSPNKNKKYRAVFYRNGEEFKHTDFGAEGGTLQDFTEHKDVARKEKFLSRFNKLIKKYEDNPYSPMTLSHLVLWNKPTLKSSWDFYKKKFGFVKII